MPTCSNDDCKSQDEAKTWSYLWRGISYITVQVYILLVVVNLLVIKMNFKISLPYI